MTDKFCKDCKHFVSRTRGAWMSGGIPFDSCLRPKLNADGSEAIDPVYGGIVRAVRHSLQEERDVGDCGPYGRYWQARG